MSDATDAGRWPKMLLQRAARWALAAGARLNAALRNPHFGEDEAYARDLEERVFQPRRNIAGSGPSKL